MIGMAVIMQKGKDNSGLRMERKQKEFVTIIKLKIIFIGTMP